VDALQIFLIGLRDWDLVICGQLRIAMAAATGPGEVEGEDPRIGVLDREDLMGPVAIGAAGDIGDTLLEPSTMDPFPIGPCALRMAAITGLRIYGVLMGKSLCTLMADGARERLMNGVFKRFYRFILMAEEAILRLSWFA